MGFFGGGAPVSCDLESPRGLLEETHYLYSAITLSRDC